ncbi:MAG: hypothetical protein ACTSR2_00865 [Candidatus Hodarchaeales archaeon]
MQTKEDSKEKAIKKLREELKGLKKAEEEIQKGRDLEDLEIRQPLSIEKNYRITIQLSWGGGADGFILEYNKDKELIGGFYYWADWGFYQELPLTLEEAERVESVYLGGDGSAWLD